MTIHAYRKSTVTNKLVAIEVEDIEDEHAFFFEGTVYQEVENAVEEQTRYTCSGPTLFLITKGN